MIDARPPRLSLREKAAQMIFPDFRFDEPDYERVVRLAKAGVGGVCLFGGSIFEVTPLVNTLQNVAPHPLLVGADFETGVAMQVKGATRLPTNMAVGATGSEELAELKGRVTAREARALGVPWVLAPVVDIASNPANPIVNVRSFGQDPALVARLGAAFARGVRSAGALSCAKHFPGHGDVTADSHIELPRLCAPRERLDAVELRPFRGLETDSVMLAHLLVDAIDPDRPASLSPAAVRVLVEELRFGGLIVTDALMMGAVTKHCAAEEAVLRAAEAGAHAILYPVDPLGAIDVLVTGVESGRLDEALVDRAVGRIWEAKRKARVLGERITDPEGIEGVVGGAEHEAAADRIAEASITKARDTGILPLSGGVRYAAVRDDSARGDCTVFEKSIVVDGASDTGVLAVFSSYRAFSGRTKPDDEALGRARRELGGVKRLVVVSFGNPYVEVPEAQAYVCAFSESRASQKAAARALRGEIPFRGRMPVAVPACPGA
jgi:beta-N-acetylhexosaminidase